MAKKDKDHTNKVFDLRTDITAGASGEYHPKFTVSFGSFEVDKYLTAHNGLPSGCYVMISSKDEGVFKTTTGNRILKQVQDLGHPVGVVDSEYKWSFKRGRSNGLDTDDPKKFYYSEPLTGEEALRDVELMMTDHGCKAIMLDSVDGAQPEIGLDHEYGDACVTGDTEILTEHGFIRFDQLQSPTKVAQYNTDGSIEYVYPTNYIKQRYTGPMYHIVGSYHTDLIVSPNHDLVFKSARSQKLKKEKPEHCKFHGNKLCVNSGLKYTGDSTLTPEERLWIVFQADGNRSIKSRHRNKLYFTFTSPRKIERFKQLMSDGGFTYNRISNSRTNSRYSVDYPKPISKNLKDFFNVSDINYVKARKIIHEALHWDGCVINCHRYDNTNEESVNFFQELCVIAGYRSLKSMAYPKDHKPHWNALYRLSISPNTSVSYTGSIKKTKIHHDGYIYCVEVPSTMFIVRRNGKVSVTGNSIGAHAKLFNNAARRLSKMCRKYDCLLLVINQMRGNITNVGGRPQQLGYKASGGRGLPFYSHCNFEIFQGEAQSTRVDKDLIPLRISIRRNSMGPSWKDVKVFALQYYGIDPYSEMVDIAVTQKLIIKSGSWYKHDKNPIGQGRESVRDWLEIHGATVKFVDNKPQVIIPYDSKKPQ